MVKLQIVTGKQNLRTYLELTSMSWNNLQRNIGLGKKNLIIYESRWSLCILRLLYQHLLKMQTKALRPSALHLLMNVLEFALG